MTQPNQDRDAPLDDFFDFDKAALSDAQILENSLHSVPQHLDDQQTSHSLVQPEAESRTQAQTSLQHQPQISLAAQYHLDRSGAHETSTPERDRTTALQLPNFSGDIPLATVDPQTLLSDSQPNHQFRVYPHPSGIPLIFVQPQGQPQGQPQYLPGAIRSYYPSTLPPHPPGPRADELIPQAQMQEYIANRDMINRSHQLLRQQQPSGWASCSAELDGTSVTIHGLASQLTALLPASYIAMEGVPLSPASYIEIRQYVHPFDLSRTNLLQGFMGGDPDSTILGCTVVEPVLRQAIAMGRVERRSQYPLFPEEKEYMLFQIRDLAMLPGRTPGTGGLVISSLLFVALQVVPKDARFAVYMVLPKGLRVWCETLPGVHRVPIYPEYPVFAVQGRKT